MRFVRVAAADKGVEAVDAVNQSMFKQKVEAAVNGGRFDAVVFGGK